MFRRRRRDKSGVTGEQVPEQDWTTVEEAGPAEEEYESVAGDLTADEAWPAEEAGYAAEGEYDELAYTDPDYTGDLDQAESGGGDADGATAGQPARADLSDPATWTRLRDTQTAEPAMARSAGPWDGASDYPERPRMDFGSLLVPMRDGYDIQVMMSEEEGIAVAVVRGESGIQLQPFAAPRSSGLWHEVLPEIVQEVAKAGGQSAERDGPFGPELVARVVPQGAGTSVAPQPLRIIGVDGPRWFLRGLISGPAAMEEDLAQQFRDILADVVVVRGDQAQPPRQPLQIQLPDEARQVLEDQAGEQQYGQLNPFERGPEITETR